MTANDLVEVLTEFWGLLVAIATGVGSVIAFKSKQKKSTTILYSDLENIKIKLLAQFEKEVRLTRDVAERDILIEQFKAYCPDCYEKFEKKRKNGEYKGLD